MIHIRMDISMISIVFVIVTAFYLFMAWLFYKATINTSIIKFRRFSVVVFWPFWFIYGLSLIILEKVNLYADNFRLEFQEKLNKELDKTSKQ